MQDNAPSPPARPSSRGAAPQLSPRNPRSPGPATSPVPHIPAGRGALPETQPIALWRMRTEGPETSAACRAWPQMGVPLAAQVPGAPGSIGPHLFHNVQQAVEVVGMTALGQVHQQLGGQFPDLGVFVLWDVGEL